MKQVAAFPQLQGRVGGKVQRALGVDEAAREASSHQARRNASTLHSVHTWFMGCCKKYMLAVSTNSSAAYAHVRR